MLKKIIVIDDNNEIQLDTEKEVIELLIDEKFYDLTEEEKKKKIELKALANCLGEGANIEEIVKEKYVLIDEKTYIFSLLKNNKIILLERVDSEIFTSEIDKTKIKENYILVNTFAEKLLERYVKKLKYNK